MTIIYLRKLEQFGKEHANARKSPSAWKQVVQTATWKNKQHVPTDFPRAKMIKNNRPRFEIVHNLYRLIAHIDYEDAIVEIRFIGTHNEYEHIDPATI